MNFIGEQISIVNSEKESRIVILSLKDKIKNILLFIWLFVWSVCGVIMITQYFATTNPDIKTVIIVWLGFWCYFEFKIAKAHLWRKTGKEIIKIKNGKLIYKKEVSHKGKTTEYDCETIKNLRVIEPKENSFMDTINNSYWVIGGEKLAFDYFGNEIKIGFQLKEEDAKALLKLLKSKIVT
jgi:hypothetical protein